MPVEFHDIQRTREMDMELARMQLRIPLGASYEIYMSDFKEYDKASIMYEYEIIKDLESEFGHVEKYQAWKKALMDTINWHTQKDI